MEASNSEQYVTNALIFLANIEQENYAKLKEDPERMMTLRAETQNTVDELLETIKNVKEKTEAKVTIKQAFKHLPKQRIDQIESTFRNMTDHMGYGKAFPPDVGRSNKVASIVVESVILILDIVGIHVPKNERALKEAITGVMGKTASLIQYVDNLEKACRENDVFGMANAIVSIAIDLFKEGIFVTIAKALLNNMSWFDWLINATKFAAFLFTLIGTGGAAEIAEIVSVLANMAEFLVKQANLDAFA